MRQDRKAAGVVIAGLAAVMLVAFQLDNYQAPATPAVPQSEISVQTVRRVHTPDELDVGLDASGRPYDADSASFWASNVERSFYTSLVAPGGWVAVMDGNAVEVDPWNSRGEANKVVFLESELDVFVHREFFERDDGDWDQVLAVEVAAPGATVVAWDDFEYGYGTSGGVGGIVSDTLIEAAKDKSENSDLFIESDYEDDIEVHDLDGTPGNDAIIFSNGLGDGGFPMVRGRDENGDVVALVVFDNRYPWRLMFPSATPPSDVTLREDELAACLAGERDVWIWSVPGREDSRACPNGDDQPPGG